MEQLNTGIKTKEKHKESKVLEIPHALVVVQIPVVLYLLSFVTFLSRIGKSLDFLLLI